MLLGVVLTGIYYAGVRVLETYVTPNLGWLLGLARTPTGYTPDPPSTGKPEPLSTLSANLARRDEQA